MNYSIGLDNTEGVEIEVNSLYEALLKVTDGRHARGKRYSLATILTLSILAKLGGEDTPEGIADWVKLRGKQVCQHLGLRRTSLPHAVTYRRVLGHAVDLTELERVVGTFFAGQASTNKALAIDGKSMRGTIETGETRGVHLLAVYGVESGVVLKQVDVTVKENEISAAPRVLAQVALENKVVTGDAMFAQRELSAQIVGAGGHYLWQVKDNQPTLRADIERLFAPERTWPGSAALQTDFQTVCVTTKGHGRLTSHTLTSSSLLNATSDWPKLAQVFQVVRQVRYIKSGKTTAETSYGITSLPIAQASPRQLLALKGGHWAIENKLHYCRDVTFHEDACRLAIGHAAQTIAILNNLTLGLLRLSGFTAIAHARRQFDASLLNGLLLIFSAFS